MIKKVIKIAKLIGNTPVLKLDDEFIDLYAKLEFKNFSGSIKDRAVNNIIHNAIFEQKIDMNTTIVESSSGNFAISLALHCKFLNLKFIAVVDPNINEISLKTLQLLATEVIMIKDIDETGGYLLNRIAKVKEVLKQTQNSFWTNQYENENNYKSYRLLANEIIRDFEELDYLFVPVSSCGTIVGLSTYLKSNFKDLKIIGVDVEGSMIFSDKKKRRNLSGLGSSKKSHFRINELIDDFIILNQNEISDGCTELLNQHALFGGASSGACYKGAQKYLKNNDTGSIFPKAMILIPDSGVSYIDNIYNKEWVEKFCKIDEMNFENN
ncbi:pyridoxal-phosphate dependent enzyme [Flavobacterium sp. ZT3R18]|uniref:pyridoxal-phosphate dependent enzyme n=1 Tax=Flavobacterium sp. ZT3R18 TaxID=2594429 RepID=UPI001179E176|nr:pyridoxal-phosphate dependent enzyme [Flavobacterium sp. ZT3R18]TRX32537.1 pyridoxal-phosphate dependent enzyme [Flavobacterium sp. ZT3R18]